MVATAILTGSANAKSLRNDDGPAEFPPASYTGAQYVDSKGCVYIRAGYAGQTEWIPRVTRGRDVMCGFKPTLAPSQPAPTAQSTSAKAPVSTVATTTKPPRVTTTTKPVPTPAASTPAPVAAPVPAPAPVAKPAPAAAPKPAPEPATPACPGASELSSQYINSGRKKPVRCGPQTISPYGKQGALDAPTVVPKGYKLAWEDDRLNPRRGLGTAAGDAEMAMVWSNDVPARLLTAKEIQVARAASAKTGLTVHVSTRSAPVAKAAPVAATAPQPASQPKTAQAAAHRGPRGYVQVGTYGDPANAKAAVARLQKLKLPVAVARGAVKGKPVQVVYAGPFAETAQMNSALGAVRKAGYQDAFVR
ncbi:SPOR domain-containing protein [Actibacterium sp.]|uniref:SPOR domain-containing protein n=1 Tax=Actibacterium sp. TaxID=1872125 RepID=UPI00356526E4